MSVIEPIYVNYATKPHADGDAALVAKIFRPDDAEEPVPVLVWFHSGGFRSGDIESRTHVRLARQIAKFGYGCAFVSYRLRCSAEDLSAPMQALLPDLMADAALKSPDINPAFIGAAAMGAMEDGISFLEWIAANGKDIGLSDHIVLGGSSAGAMTILNMLHLTPRIGKTIPRINSAIALSGAFAYPSFFSPIDTPVLALHDSDDQQISPLSIRGYSYLAGDGCTLIEHAAHQHGDLRITREESIRQAVRRLVRFDRGKVTPEGRIDRPDRPASTKNRICLFTCMRNERPFLLEWIAHNRAIGVTDFLIFSNDCDDGTTELLDVLQDRGIVVHVRNPSASLQSDQYLGLTIACAKYAQSVRHADYVILSDVDEFIQVNVADGTLNGLIATLGHPDVISLSEQLYGFGGVTGFKDDLVTSQFRVSDPLIAPEDSGLRRGVKSIMRMPTCHYALANHRPVFPQGTWAALDWVDGSGQPVPEDFIENGRRGLDIQGRYALARVNHYTLRSAESMLVKFQRGDAVRPGRMRQKYFTERNGSGYRNDGFLPHIARLRQEYAVLLEDPDLKRLHGSAVARHKAKIAALKGDPDFQEVWQAILAEAEPTTDVPDLRAEQPVFGLAD